MSILELKGCGVLSEASINCPLLTSLDASFCRLCRGFQNFWLMLLIGSLLLMYSFSFHVQAACG